MTQKNHFYITTPAKSITFMDTLRIIHQKNYIFTQYMKNMHRIAPIKL